MSTSKEKVEKEKSTAKKATDVKNTKVEKEKSTIKKSSSKKQPKFESKEVLVLDGKDCVFVERVEDKILVRFIEGGYASAEESKFKAK